MNRRALLKYLGLSAVAAPALPAVLAAKQMEETPSFNYEAKTTIGEALDARAKFLQEFGGLGIDAYDPEPWANMRYGRTQIIPIIGRARPSTTSKKDT